MKSKKKKVAFPRRSWQINPVTRVKESSKKYSRPRVKGGWRKQADETNSGSNNGSESR
jgi:hypothetical protein